MEITEEQQAFVVMNTRDKTEGRSPSYPRIICRIQATAERLAKGQWVQGSDAPVQQTTLCKIGNHWYGPVNIIEPEPSDHAAQKWLEEKQKARAKLLEAGFTSEDIRLANL